MTLQEDTLRLLQWEQLCQHLSRFAQTPPGIRACEQLLPAQQQTDAEWRLRLTQEALLLESRLATGISLTGVYDIQAAVQRAAKGVLLEGEELLHIASTLQAARRLRRLLAEREESDTPELLDLVQPLRTCPEVEQRILYCLDETGRVMDRASPQLAEARAQQQRLRDRVQKTLQSMLQRQPNFFQEQVITERDQRFVLLVKVNYKEQVPGILHDTSATGQTFYIEPMSVIDDQNRQRQWQRTEAQEVERILWELSGLVASEFSALIQLVEILTLIDGATSRARYAQQIGAVAPKFTDHLYLEKVCHPLLVAQTQLDPSRTVVPIQVELSPPLRCVVLTGPNTGGKTLTLKTVGLAVLMAKAGLFIPAAVAQLPWCPQVLADIGDEQSLEQNLSTFSGHIRRIVKILALVQGADLVLLDEVGAGTDPQEGAALAAALLSHLAQVSRYTLATTHYGELKALKYQDPRFENASVEFDEVSLAPTYRLRWGIPGRSNALNIARRLGMDPAVLETAQSWLDPASQKVDGVIAQLEQQRREQEQQTQNALDSAQLVEKLARDLAAQKEALVRERLQLQQQAQTQLTQALAEAKAQVVQVIRQLQANPTAQQAQAAQQALSGLSPSQGTVPAPDYQPKIGDRVQILSLGQTGEVLAVDAHGQVQVRCGVLKLTVPSDQLWPAGKQRPPQPVAAPPLPKIVAKPPAIRLPQNTIDLRGQRVGDIETLLLDKLSTQYGTVWIIHGHGTGRLRKGVHEFLQGYDRTETYSLAEANDGGSGATVVHLR